MQVSLPFPFISCQPERNSLHYSRSIKPCKCILNDFTVVIITLSSQGCAELVKIEKTTTIKNPNKKPYNKNNIGYFEQRIKFQNTYQMYEYNSLELRVV